MEPLINWKELQFARLGRPAGGPGGAVDWSAMAAMYARMAEMEAEHTTYQVDAFPTDAADTVLDIGCGPGRISVPMARRAARVTAMDSASGMLDACRANVAAAGLDNVDYLQLDWHEAVAGENVPLHDIVICSRTVALGQLERLSEFARKRVAVVMWANAPSIPPILDRIFEGAQDPQNSMRGHGSPDRRLAYNVLYNIVYDLGFEPNVVVVPDGFTRTFATPEEEYDYLRVLRPMLPGAQAEAAFLTNVDHFTTTNPDGSVTFLVTTRSVVLWWDVHPASYEEVWPTHAH